MRSDGRAAHALRTVRVIPRFTKYAEGSVLYRQGETQVLCTASVQDSVPPFLRGKGQGWVTAEYGMLPRSTHTRTDREAARGKQSGRTQEIQRLIGRALRMCVNLKAIGERTIVVDCDVLQADAGTRTASITGGCIALAHACPPEAFLRQVAAVSVGVVKGQALLDLTYEEDSQAEVDLNVVMTSDGRLVEVQGTAEQTPFSVAQLHALVELAQKGIRRLVRRQSQAIKSFRVPAAA